jgi:3'(2'), 5'-bisphosphate nucleotidase
MNSETETFIHDLQKKYDQLNIVTAGSSLKFCLIAEGAADLYPRFAPTMEWDTAAGQAIVEGIGGKVINAKSGQVLAYNKEHLVNPHFIASFRGSTI